jgi:nitric oxide synthase oxygenase domain/subunit
MCEVTSAAQSVSTTTRAEHGGTAMTLMQMPPNANHDAWNLKPQGDDARIDICAEAMQFLHQMRAERGERGPDSARIEEVLRQIGSSGTYAHTIEELTWGAKVAWRNTPRCLGKFYWSALQLIDARHLMRESEAGRITPAKYDLIVAPTGGSATPLWGRQYEPTILRPNFFAQPMPWRAAPAGSGGKCPFAHS